MTIQRLPAGTEEFLRARIRVQRDAIDPTTYTVQFALIGRNEMPEVLDWQAAAWEVGGPPYIAQSLYVGVAGSYRLWVEVTTPDEIVLRDAGLVEFYVEA